MPKKKGSKKLNNADVTIHNFADNVYPGRRSRKLDTKPKTAVETWEGFLDDDYDIVEEADSEGGKSLICKKKKNKSKPAEDNVDDRPGIVYPEIIWYFISRYIKPEDVIHFALICKDAYAVTKTESFWRMLYNTYNKGRNSLPEKLNLDNNSKSYGLRQRVIRGLFHTYFKFKMRLDFQSLMKYTPHMLVKRRCVSVWYTTGCDHEWVIYLKLKKLNPLEREQKNNFLEEMGRVDANPDEDIKLLQVRCKRYLDVPPVMGMILTSVTLGLCHGFRYNKLVLGFHTNQHASRDIEPDISIIMAPVSTMIVYDWWHPLYPHYDSLPPCDVDEKVTLLEGDFFGNDDACP